jgi:hypothetical protein
VAVGSGSYSVAYSDDGGNWTGVDLPNSPLPSSGGSQVAIGQNNFVVIAAGAPNSIIYSMDGKGKRVCLCENIHSFHSLGHAHHPQVA